MLKVQELRFATGIAAQSIAGCRGVDRQSCRRHQILIDRIIEVMDERDWDKLLRIKTSGRDDSHSNQVYYPYEPTSYAELSLVEEIDCRDVERRTM